MNKILLLACMSCLFCLAAPAQGKQKNTSTPPPPQQEQKKPPPYVFKKDYDVQMTDVMAKVNTAYNTSVALKKDLAGKLDKVDELENKMTQVEEILNSANFKISNTSDSLKKTNFSVVEFRNETDQKIAGLQTADMQFGKVWWLVGGAFLFTLVVMLVMALRMKKLKASLRALMEQQGDEMKATLAEELDKQQKEQKSDLQYMKIRLQDDIKGLKTEIMEQVNSGSEATASQLQLIMDKLDKG